MKTNSTKTQIPPNNRKNNANKKEKLSKRYRKSTSTNKMTKIMNKIINRKIFINSHKVKINLSSSMANKMISNRIKRISSKNLIKMIPIR